MLRRIIFAISLTVLLAANVFGQQAGQIVGAVTDSRGEAVPGLTVKAVEIGTGFTRSAVTEADGRYVLPALRPTQYEMTVEAQGFRSFRRTGLELLANQSLTVNIKRSIVVPPAAALPAGLNSARLIAAIGNPRKAASIIEIANAPPADAKLRRHLKPRPKKT